MNKMRVTQDYVLSCFATRTLSSGIAEGLLWEGLNINVVHCGIDDHSEQSEEIPRLLPIKRYDVPIFSS